MFLNKTQTAATQTTTQYQSASSSNNQSNFVWNKSKSDEDLDPKSKAGTKKITEARKKSGIFEKINV